MDAPWSRPASEAEPSAPDAPTRTEPDAVVSRGRGFWLAFTAGWTLYAGLIVVATIAEGESPAVSLATVVAVAVPAALVGAVVAGRRRDLLRPDRSLRRTAGLHAVTGLAYATVCVVLTHLAVRALGPVVPEVLQWVETPVYVHGVTYLFLYVLLAGFLMWTESIARVQESRAVAAREAMLRAQAEATAVRARFNPHFVFNTLHSLLLLVRAEPETAERAIEDVAALIRYASRLEKEELDQVPLEEEMAFARRYLALEELRLADRLRVSWDVDESLGRTRVPAFSLQTLLENAVKHGVAPRPSGGMVRVGAVREDGVVVLSVEDDGAGADAAEVDESGGRGLRLLRERVRVLYGGEGRMSWRTRPGAGFRAEIRVPDGDVRVRTGPSSPRGKIGGTCD